MDDILGLKIKSLALRLFNERRALRAAMRAKMRHFRHLRALRAGTLTLISLATCNSLLHSMISLVACMARFAQSPLPEVTFWARNGRRR